MIGMILGPDGIIVIAVVAIVLIFGGSRLPQLARGLGSASHEFKKGAAESEESGSGFQEKPVVAETSETAAALEEAKSNLRS